MPLTVTLLTSWSVDYVIDRALSNLHMLHQVLLTTMLYGRYYHSPHLTDKKNEATRGYVT